MSVFFYDYDHNAPSIGHLKETHEKGFKAIRKQNPELPIVIMSRPVYYPAEFETERFNIIKDTYENAVKNGDKNVYLIDGKTLMKLAQDMISNFCSLVHIRLFCPFFILIPPDIF